MGGALDDPSGHDGQLAISLSQAAQVGADDPAELAQDGIAIAAALLASAEARGKKVSAGNVAFYATPVVGKNPVT